MLKKVLLSCPAFAEKYIKIGVMEIKKHAPISNFSTLCYVISRILCGVNVMNYSSLSDISLGHLAFGKSFSIHDSLLKPTLALESEE